MLHGKHMRIQIGEPLLAGLRDPQMPQPIRNIPRHHVPEKGRIAVPHLARSGVAQARRRPGFELFIKQGRQLPQVRRIGELPDQVGSPDQAGIIGGALMIPTPGNREPGPFDIRGQAFDLQQRMVAKAFPDKALAAIHVVGRQRRIRAARRQGHLPARDARGIHAIAVLPADAPDIADIMAQQRQDHMQPVGMGVLMVSQS